MFIFVSAVSIFMSVSVFALDREARIKTVELPDSVKEYLEKKGGAEQREVLAYRAIEDLKNMAEMCFTGKDTIRGLQYLVIGMELFPFRKDIAQREAQILELAIQSTNEIAKSETKNCESIQKRASYILSIAPDVNSLGEASKSCAIVNKRPEISEKRTKMEIINEKIPEQKLELSEGDCESGNMKVCLAMGLEENKINHNQTKAKKYYLKACNGGEGHGC